MQKTSLKDLVKVSLYTGATAYGGPAMFAQIKKKFVIEKKWIDENPIYKNVINPPCIRINLKLFTERNDVTTKTNKATEIALNIIGAISPN